MKTAGLILILFAAAFVHAADTPQISADLGPCYTDFKVTDTDSKPVYAANIHVLIRYGFMSKRKTDLTIGTNADGVARVSGLPSYIKRPFTFEVSKGTLMQKIEHDPGANCHARYDVKLTQ